VRLTGGGLPQHGVSPIAFASQVIFKFFASVLNPARIYSVGALPAIQKSLGPAKAPTELAGTVM
jgi:hypothetical protein